LSWILPAENSAIIVAIGIGELFLNGRESRYGTVERIEIGEQRGVERGCR
jgi:hypothetical protein